MWFIPSTANREDFFGGGLSAKIFRGCDPSWCKASLSWHFRPDFGFNSIGVSGCLSIPAGTYLRGKISPKGFRWWDSHLFEVSSVGLSSLLPVLRSRKCEQYLFSDKNWEKMREGSCSEEDCLELLNQFEHVLESDPLIDEVGFIHPSQFNMLDNEAGSSNVYQNEVVPNNGISRKFWNQDHKLGISTDLLIQLCKVAKHVFLAALKEYKCHGNACNESQIKSTSSEVSCSLRSLESEVMKHSQAVLLLSSDFRTAWNARKLIMSKEDQLSAFTEELRLSGLVLSNSPKSESTWSHRRWIIKMISWRFSTLQEIISKESELVESIGERSKMNYRSWYHRCWLVSYMEIEQVIQELKKSKRWAGLHVADSSCFHYRRRLMLKILESLNVKGSNAHDETEAHKIWMEELDWNKELLERYMGREALWLHRRFLSLNWIMHFACNHSDVSSETGQGIIMNEEIAIFIDDEIYLLESATTIPDTKFEDFQAQALHAAVYMLWLTKHIPELWRILEEKLGTKKLKCVLSSVVQDRPSLLHNLVNMSRFY